MRLQSANTAYLTRRDVLRSAATFAATATLGQSCLAEDAHTTVPRSIDKPIGIQVGAVSFVDEGVVQVLDNFQRLGAVNTIFLTTFTYERGLSGRQIPGQPFPDHGVQTIMR